VGHLVQEVVEQMRPRCALANCELTLEGNDAPLCAVCDPRRLRRVVHNILENAYRYTTSVRDDGHVQVTLAATDQQIICTIRDNGRGIAPDKLELLGQKFLRLRQGQNDPEGMGPLKCRLFRRIALECGQWNRQRLPLQCSIFCIGTGCGRAEARPYQKKPTPERGMGLGLNFSIGILRLNGGNLQVTSAGEGQGTTVTVMLPRNLNET
jgi:signal transduction histidine kinase